MRLPLAGRRTNHAWLTATVGSSEVVVGVARVEVGVARHGGGVEVDDDEAAAQGGSSGPGASGQSEKDISRIRSVSGS